MGAAAMTEEHYQQLIKDYNDDPIIKMFKQRLYEILSISPQSYRLHTNGLMETIIPDWTQKEIDKIQIQLNSHIKSHYSELFPHEEFDYAKKLSL